MSQTVKIIGGKVLDIDEENSEDLAGMKGEENPWNVKSVFFRN